MKKALSYTVAAMLLGTVTMLVPYMMSVEPGYIRLLNPSYGEAVGRRCFEGETLATGDALVKAVRPSNLSSAGLMLIPSFLLALGVSLYLKKRIF